jgi:hypothetical protein
LKIGDNRYKSLSLRVAEKVLGEAIQKNGGGKLQRVLDSFVLGFFAKVYFMAVFCLRRRKLA